MEKVYVDDFLENNNLGHDFILALKNNIDGLVESHIDAWRDRYYPKSVDDISYDLYVNHDISLEVEAIEHEIGRDLELEEFNVLEAYFNESVLNEFR